MPIGEAIRDYSGPLETANSQVAGCGGSLIDNPQTDSAAKTQHAQLSGGRTYSPYERRCLCCESAFVVCQELGLPISYVGRSSLSEIVLHPLQKKLPKPPMRYVVTAARDLEQMQQD